MNLANIKEFLLILTPFIMTLGGVISALFVKIYNAKNNYKSLKEELIKLTEDTQKKQASYSEELAKRDIVIRNLKEELSQALATIELLKTKVDTNSGSAYVSKLEESNNSYKSALDKARELLKNKDNAIAELKADLIQSKAENNTVKEQYKLIEKELENRIIEDKLKEGIEPSKEANKDTKATLY